MVLLAGVVAVGAILGAVVLEEVFVEMETGGAVVAEMALGTTSIGTSSGTDTVV